MKEKKEDAEAPQSDVTQEPSPAPAKENAAQDLEELKKQHLYLRADFENYRKQMIRERSELIKYGAEPVLREFIGILDNLERAAHAEVTPETLDSYKNGIELILSQFKKTLERFGVEEIESQGQIFDPMVHEALSSENDPNKPPQVITHVFKKPFKLHGKVIRPGQVVVNTPKKEE